MQRLENNLKTIREMQPIIIVGMHRSGTSLLSRLFSDLGIFMGDWLSRDAEAVFFQKINRRVYRKTRSHWAEPEALLEAVNSPHFIEQQADFVRKQLAGSGAGFNQSPLISKNFRKDIWEGLSAGEDLAWGFKDPRTALLIPVWDQVFPNARWVHIYRSGVDVALSLHQRALRQKDKLVLKLYRFDFSKRTLDFEYCFHLWELYMDEICAALAQIDQSRVFEMRYEDLLRDPIPELKNVLEYVKVEAAEDLIARSAAQIDSSRLDNFKTASKYQDLIDDLPESHWLDALGYS